MVLFVKLREGLSLDAALEERIRRQIREYTSPRHVPARIVQVPDIPRTKNGKVVELAVRSMVHGMPVTHTDALANPEVLALFRNMPALAAGAESVKRRGSADYRMRLVPGSAQAWIARATASTAASRGKDLRYVSATRRSGTGRANGT